MVEYLLVILITFVIVYALVKGCHINITINVKQQFSEEDRQLLEDLYNKEGDLKEKDASSTIDDVVSSINSFMLGEEESNG